MKPEIKPITLLMLLLLGLQISVARAAFVMDSDYNGVSNDTFSTAQNIDAYFDTSYNELIQDAALVNISTSLPHAQILSFAGFGTSYDYYSFHALAGTSVIIDVDCGYWAGSSSDPCGVSPPLGGGEFDSFIRLIRPSGAEAVFNDDYVFNPFDTGTDQDLDSFLEYTMWEPGLWVIEISNLGNAIYDSDSYQLNVSLSEVPVPTAFWLFGTALVGFIGFSRRTTV